MKKVVNYFSEVWAELAKVSWPIRKGKNLSFYDRCGELIESVIAVIITVAIFTGFIAIVDFVFSKLVDLLIS